VNKASNRSVILCRHALPAILTSAIGYLIGTSSSAPSAQTSYLQPIQWRAASPDPVDTHHAGLESPLEVELEAVAVENGARGETLRMELRVLDRRGPSRAAYQAELVTDTGETVWRAPAPEIRRLTEHETVESLRTTESLDDGYFVYKVTVVAGNDEDSTLSSLAIQYLYVENGSLYPVDANTFFSRSNANRVHLVES